MHRALQHSCTFTLIGIFHDCYLKCTVDQLRQIKQIKYIKYKSYGYRATKHTIARHLIPIFLRVVCM